MNTHTSAGDGELPSYHQPSQDTSAPEPVRNPAEQYKTDVMALSFCSILRYSALWYFGINYEDTKKLWGTTQKVSQLDGWSGTFVPSLVEAEYATMRWTVISYIWNGLSVVSFLIFPGPLSGISAAIDLYFGYRISSIHVVLGSVLPLEDDFDCGRNIDFFNASYSSCEDFQDQYSRLKVSYVLYCVLSVCAATYWFFCTTNIVLSCMMKKKGHRWEYLRQRLNYLFIVFQFLFWLVLAILRILATPLVYTLRALQNCIANNVLKARARYAKRYARKKVQHLREPGDVELQDMNYQDFVTMQWANGSNCDHSSSDRTNDDKCFLCTNKTCRDCSTDVVYPYSSAQFHHDTCRPYCRECYISFVLPRQCDCYTASRVPNSTTRITCLLCATENADNWNEKDEQTKRELKDPRREGMHRCYSCAKGLRKGPRWWICFRCRRECTSREHLVWSKYGHLDQEFVDTVI